MSFKKNSKSDIKFLCESLAEILDLKSISLTDTELDFLYTFIKNNYEYYLKNPNLLDISKYKDKFSSENYTYSVMSDVLNREGLEGLEEMKIYAKKVFEEYDITSS